MRCKWIWNVEIQVRQILFYVTINILLEERKLKLKELKIDPELRDLLPPLTDEEYKQLEKNITENGFGM